MLEPLSQSYTEACARVSEGFCPIDAGRLTPATAEDGSPGGFCSECCCVWYRYSDGINFCPPRRGTAEFRLSEARMPAVLDRFARAMRDAPGPWRVP